MKYRKTTLREKAVAEMATQRARYLFRIGQQRVEAVRQKDAALKNQQEMIDRLQGVVSTLRAAQDDGVLVSRGRAEQPLTDRRVWGVMGLLTSDSDIKEMELKLNAELADEEAVPTSAPEGTRIRQLTDLVDLLDMVEDDTVSTHALEQAGWRFPIPR